MSLRHLHHYTWFPFVLVGLSFVLVLLVIFFVSPRPVAPAPEESRVDEATLLRSYEEEARPLLVMVLNAQVSPEAQAVLIGTTLDQLLAVRLSSSARDFHLQTVLALHEWRNTLLSGQVDAAEEAKARLETILQNAPWRD